ncbi:UPF0280 family protein [Fusibacter sp. 3D3]|uniref:UPF0280 family protein n=1 Tax=Fusibacter sp. 3D3 TaxID=1048380 RepID=UPI0008531332|nr:UPF0280 family protein [Fusibacter sp. 3D3]GAU78609.1 hypothetical protein F3D3_3243 [Fusibacter sp. 3D3]
MYQERVYRREMNASGLFAYTVAIFESDLMIYTDKMLSEEAHKWTEYYRHEIETYAHLRPGFIGALAPQMCLKSAPPLIKHMHQASKKAGVGPMAAVAGGISYYVGQKLLQSCNEVMIENGGDIFLKSDTEKKIRIFAGDSPFSNKVALKLPPSPRGIGICTSAGKIGHSLSFGNADAVVIVSEDVLLADAVATATGNKIKTKDYINEGIDFAKSIEGVKGIVIIVEDQIGLWGEIELCK